MPIPKVNITLGSGGLGRVISTTDSVAGMILTGKAVVGKLELGKHYLLSSPSELAMMGVTKESNLLVDQQVRAFYDAAPSGAELHLVVVSEATTLTSMADDPLITLISGGGGRIRLIGLNKIAPLSYEADVSAHIDSDAILAAAAMQTAADKFATNLSPFRAFLPAAAWDGKTDGLFKPRESSYNRVAMVLASDSEIQKSAAIGRVLGRAAAISVHQSIARVKSGSIAPNGYATNGKSYTSLTPMADILADAGYIFYIKYPTKNGCYLSGDAMAAPLTDDYSELYYGRTIDKATTIIYDTYISEIQDNVLVDADGKIPKAICVSYESMIENAIGSLMGSEISDFKAYVEPNQNILSTGVINISGKIVPQGVIKEINFALEFSNPQTS